MSIPLIGGHKKTTRLDELTDVDLSTQAPTDGDDLVYDTSGFRVKKNNLAAVAPPTENDDAGDGYEIGSVWIDGDNVYVCTWAVTAEAVWEHLNKTNLDHGALAGLGDDDHPQYVKDSEFTAAGQLLLGTGTGTFTRLLNNFSATAAPTANDDSGDGYTPGSMWVDTTNDKAYVCLDATPTAAVWTETTSAGSGDVATDAIFDAKGDLPVGTGADAAQKFSVGANGSSLRAASSATTGLEWQLNNLAASTSPTSGDDSGDGYSVGSRWIDTTADLEYVCLDASLGAAVWKETTASGGGGGLYTDSSVSGAHSVDRDLGETHDLTLTGNATLTPDAGAASDPVDLRLIVRQDGTGGHTLAFGGTITWAGGVAPTMPSVASSWITFYLTSVDGGTTWLGFFDRTAEVDAFDPDVHMPRRIEIYPQLGGEHSSVGTWIAAYHTEANPFVTGVTNGAGGYATNPPAQNDYIQYLVPMCAGTWTVVVFVRRSTNTGIITVSLDAGSTSEGTIDTYNASADNYRGSITGISVASTGLKQLRLAMDTKNASSSGYAVTLRAIMLVRTS